VNSEEVIKDPNKERRFREKSTLSWKNGKKMIRDPEKDLVAKRMMSGKYRRKLKIGYMKAQ
jgi:hypothetical protein